MFCSKSYILQPKQEKLIQLFFLIKSAYFATAVIYARKMFTIFAIEIENVFLYLSIPVERV